MSNNADDPAFPVHGLPGMSLRDYFAAKAMQGMMAVYFAEFSGDGEPFKMIENEQVSVTAEMIAEECFAVADAMLKARN